MYRIAFESEARKGAVLIADPIITVTVTLPFSHFSTY
jgi:hypothetical protein